MKQPFTRFSLGSEGRGTPRLLSARTYWPDLFFQSWPQRAVYIFLGEGGLKRDKKSQRGSYLSYLLIRPIIKGRSFGFILSGVACQLSCFLIRIFAFENIMGGTSKVQCCFN